MSLRYEGKCKMGKVVFMAIAETPLEQADCAQDIKRLIKQGIDIKLVDYPVGSEMPEWCFDSKGGRRCKTCQ